MSGWISVNKELPTPGQLIQGRNSDGAMWTETFDPREPLGRMVEWRGVAPARMCTCPQHGSWISWNDTRALVKQMDVALNGKEGAAPEPRLLDIVAQVNRMSRQADGQPLMMLLGKALGRVHVKMEFHDDNVICSSSLDVSRIEPEDDGAVTVVVAWPGPLSVELVPKPAVGQAAWQDLFSQRVAAALRQDGWGTGGSDEEFQDDVDDAVQLALDELGYPKEPLT